MSDTPAPCSKPAPDWERIEIDYRAGIKSLREIAGEHGVSHGAVNKRAKRDGWDRDLSAKIRAKADALVSKAEVSTEVSRAKADTERETVEANATAIVQIRLAHRSDIRRSRGVVANLLGELEAQTGPEAVELMQRLGELMADPDERGRDRLGEIYQRIIDLPNRSKSAQTLVAALKGVVDLERQAWGMDAEREAPPESPLAGVLAQLIGRSGGLPAPGEADD